MELNLIMFIPGKSPQPMPYPSTLAYRIQWETYGGSVKGGIDD